MAEKVEELETRLATLESKQGRLGTDDGVLLYQAQTVEKLKAIRDLMTSDSSGSNDVKRERDEAIARNKELEKEIERLKYRVNHLVKALNNEEQKHAGCNH